MHKGKSFLFLKLHSTLNGVKLPLQKFFCCISKSKNDIPLCISYFLEQCLLSNSNYLSHIKSTGNCSVVFFYPNSGVLLFISISFFLIIIFRWIIACKYKTYLTTKCNSTKIHMIFWCEVLTSSWKQPKIGVTHVLNHLCGGSIRIICMWMVHGWRLLVTHHLL